MGWYPSSQRGRAVNAVALPSGVQIPPSPHKNLKLKYQNVKFWYSLSANYFIKIIAKRYDNFDFYIFNRKCPGSSEAEQLHGKE